MDDLLIVPVRVCAGGSLTLHTGRLNQRTIRVGIAFTDVARLRAALGETHLWIRLGEPALRSLLAPMGITRIQLDPVRVGPRSMASGPPLRTFEGHRRHPRPAPEAWRPSSTATN